MIYAWAVERVEDRAKFDALLFAPMPGRRADPGQLASETADLRRMAAWAATAKTGG